MSGGLASKCQSDAIEFSCVHRLGVRQLPEIDLYLVMKRKK